MSEPTEQTDTQMTTIADNPEWNNVNYDHLAFWRGQKDGMEKNGVEAALVNDCAEPLKRAETAERKSEANRQRSERFHTELQLCRMIATGQKCSVPQEEQSFAVREVQNMADLLARAMAERRTAIEERDAARAGVADNPEWDNTDYAHPAFWRGQKDGIEAALVNDCAELLKRAETAERELADSVRELTRENATLLAKAQAE